MTAVSARKSLVIPSRVVASRPARRRGTRCGLSLNQPRVFVGLVEFGDGVPVTSTKSEERAIARGPLADDGSMRFNLAFTAELCAIGRHREKGSLSWPRPAAAPFQEPGRGPSPAGLRFPRSASSRSAPHPGHSLFRPPSSAAAKRLICLALPAPRSRRRRAGPNASSAARAAARAGPRRGGSSIGVKRQAAHRRSRVRRSGPRRAIRLVYPPRTRPPPT